MKRLSYAQVRQTRLPAFIRKPGGTYEYDPMRDGVRVVLPGRDRQQDATTYGVPAWGWAHVEECRCPYHMG